ncbi:MAG: histidine phosphatase family protein [Anaerolineae bacterium]|nr:histidine phosphatase family protein [Anaerolineae bacterium]
MQLYIIRHGQSFNNALWARTGGSNGRLPDPPLTEIGQKQAEYLAQFIAKADKNGSAPIEIDQHNRHGYHLTHLYSSLMLRAVQTGHAIAEALDMPLIAWPIIHEWGGIFAHDPETDEPVALPGPNRQFFIERFDRFVLPDDLQEEGWWQGPYEPEEASIHRAETFVNQLLSRHGNTEDRIGIVTHGGFTAMLIRILFNSREFTVNLHNEEFHTWLSMNNTGVTRLNFEENHIIQAYSNRVDHLPTELIT